MSFSGAEDGINPQGAVRCKPLNGLSPHGL